MLHWHGILLKKEMKGRVSRDKRKSPENNIYFHYTY